MIGVVLELVITVIVLKHSPTIESDTSVLLGSVVRKLDSAIQRG